jgi:hypothetical protein
MESIDRNAPLETLGLTLPEDLAGQFLAVVDGWRDALEKGEVREEVVAARVAAQDGRAPGIGTR